MDASPVRAESSAKKRSSPAGVTAMSSRAGLSPKF